MARTELTVPPMLLRFRGLFVNRTEAELANGMIGAGMGVVTLMPDYTLASSPALHGLLDLGPEWAWGAIWTLSGLISLFAYMYRPFWREASQLAFVVGWGFLVWEAILTIGGITLATPLYGGLALASAISYVRLRAGRQNAPQ